MTFKDILSIFRSTSFTEKDKGTRFERIIKNWFKTHPRYSNLTDVWLWEEFPAKKDFGGKDIGIDLVAKTDMGDYWAIQCKCYAEDATIDKPAVDSFLSTSSKTFTDPFTYQTTKFSDRFWVSTTNNWGANAEEAIKNQDPPLHRINLFDLESSSVDWEKLYNNHEGVAARQEGKQLFKHQLDAISSAYKHYEQEGNDRGKLIMACGTGKTFTSLRLVENLLGNKGLVLFLVPSIALLGQALNSWAADAKTDIKAVCVCSDSKVTRKKKSNDFDDTEDDIVDLALPASTNPTTVKKQILQYRNHDGLTVVFSTYQSIEAVKEAQQAVLKATNGEYGEFDMIVCDEAHRTTGVKLSDKDESEFTKVHDNDYIKGARRLYMTATPRLYGESAKIKASQKNCILCSMDDESIYGDEFYRIGFSAAVQQGLLTDYKVLVLTVNEEDLPQTILDKVKDTEHKELNFDDTTKLIGVINGLSKVIQGDDGVTWQTDPSIMHRAVAFCNCIGASDVPGSSKNVAAVFPKISEMYKESLDAEQQKRVVTVTTRHIDGTMDAPQREQIMSWLKEESENPNECKVVSNVRCLSEGIDVPSLDAVLFLSARNSQVDVVQSVGRVMRSFGKGTVNEKKYGYIIIPIVVPSDVKPEDALNNNKLFDVVWQILNALRSHDDNFNAKVNQIALNKKKSTKVTVGKAGFKIGASALNGSQEEIEAKKIENEEVERQLNLRFGEMQNAIYAKLVEKCGDRLYWENWATQVGIVAQRLIERMTRLVKTGTTHRQEFEAFLKSLQHDLNPSVDEAQAIEMLAQHMITRPVFEALFADYRFVENNSVSRSMQKMLDLMEAEGMTKDTDILRKFYESVKMNVSEIDNLEGRQTVIKNLYEKFFKGAFPLTVEKLGIVYTPIECVDFILHSVDHLLKKEFNTSLTEENVHILDPFVGTGTFITRLLQSGLIRKEDMERKYLNEIHCNEIVLLAYYIADVNIESVFHDITKREQYLNYDGICLADTFQMTEDNDSPAFFTEFFQNNNETLELQKEAPIRVIIGNPPYSIGQKAANDNAQNMRYKGLDQRISDTYAANTSAANRNSLYDSYIKAFRWASDRIASFKDGGIVAFISNATWLDGSAQDGMRKCLEEEFSSIYVFNLRGNARTSGELRRKEAGCIFDQGSRTPIAITFLVKNPNHKGKAQIYYHDIGDYLSREQKLKIIKDFRSIASKKMEWEIIHPNQKNDWINQRGDTFETLVIIGDKDDKKNEQTWFYPYYSCGLKTQRDTWCYNFSKPQLKNNIEDSIEFYNAQREDLVKGKIEDVTRDSTKFSWTRATLHDVQLRKEYNKDEVRYVEATYRPFVTEYLALYRPLNEMMYQIPKLFPMEGMENLVICVPGLGAHKPFSCFISNMIIDLNVLEAGCQCFPMYYYEENPHQQYNLFDDGSTNGKYIRRDGVTDWILKEVRKRFGGSKAITKEHIFYYVYGILHSEDYRNRFADDLKKSLPRIPIVDKVEDFMAFYNAGKQLADLHLNYETVPPYADVLISSTPIQTKEGDKYEEFRVEKMQFRKVRDTHGKLVADKSAIVYNGLFTIEKIPQKAYEYVVNGKSAIEWIMERYAVTIDKASHIKNDPNDWSKEHNDPMYIFKLLLSVINVSIQSVDIIKSLPRLEF
ncbi:MAG: DEAD/DEAH box helicase family protein [Bacteroidales bacterium]|nr:DEAD/DEAH box helicase family protein [Bacteroidales bacterium]